MSSGSMATDLLAELMAECRCGVHVAINPHRDLYESVETHLENAEVDGDLGIDAVVRAEMVRTDTVVEVQAYPDTPISFYLTRDHDLLRALADVLMAVRASRP